MPFRSVHPSFDETLRGIAFDLLCDGVEEAFVLGRADEQSFDEAFQIHCWQASAPALILSVFLDGGALAVVMALASLSLLREGGSHRSPWIRSIAGAFSPGCPGN